jgi:hypothetical protein
MQPNLRGISLLIMAVGSMAACSSSDTVLAVTVTSTADLQTSQAMLRQIRIRVTPSSGTAVEKVFDAPQMTVLVDGGVEAGGSEFMAITSSFFERVPLPSGLSGPATVRVDAFMNSANPASAEGYAWGESPATIVKNGAAAAQVMLIVGGPKPAPPDGGADGGDDASPGADAGGDASPSGDASADGG